LQVIVLFALDVGKPGLPLIPHRIPGCAWKTASISPAFRFMARGLCRHAARGVIVALFVKHYYYVMRDHKSFPLETYLRQMALLGGQGVGRNQPCLCGSGRKFQSLLQAGTVFPQRPCVRMLDRADENDDGVIAALNVLFQM